MISLCLSVVYAHFIYFIVILISFILQISFMPTNVLHARFLAFYTILHNF